MEGKSQFGLGNRPNMMIVIIIMIIIAIFMQVKDLFNAKRHCYQ